LPALHRGDHRALDLHEAARSVRPGDLLDGKFDDPKELARWRNDLSREGVWSNDPVPLFAYPGSPEYTIRWGAPDDLAWSALTPTT